MFRQQDGCSRAGEVEKVMIDTRQVCTGARAMPRFECRVKDFAFNKRRAGEPLQGAEKEGA